MINLLIGPPGGGKSYEAVVFHILPALQKGRKVITNLPLDIDRLAAIDPAYADLVDLRTMSKGDHDKSRVPFSQPADYGDTWRHPENGSGPLYVIDECHIPLPVLGTDKEVEVWYSLHRHESADVLLITQSYGKINRAIRDLVQVVYRVRKNVALGSLGSYTRKVQDGLRGEVVNRTIRRYDKRYFGLYKSHTRGGGSELAANDIKPIWKHWSFYGAFFAFLFVGYMLASGKVHAPWSVRKATVAHQSLDSGVARFHQSKPLLRGLGKPTAQSAHKGSQEPFADRGMHFVGLMREGHRQRLVLSISQNGQHQMVIDDRTLRKAGYDVVVLADCVARVTWHTVQRYVICDSPQVGVGLGVGSRAEGRRIQPESQEQAPDSESSHKPAIISAPPDNLQLSSSAKKA